VKWPAIFQSEPPDCFVYVKCPVVSIGIPWTVVGARPVPQRYVKVPTFVPVESTVTVMCIGNGDAATSPTSTAPF
jgi:hypothetical protein